MPYENVYQLSFSTSLMVTCFIFFAWIVEELCLSLVVSNQSGLDLLFVKFWTHIPFLESVNLSLSYLQQKN